MDSVLDEFKELIYQAQESNWTYIVPLLLLLLGLLLVMAIVVERSFSSEEAPSAEVKYSGRSQHTMVPYHRYSEYVKEVTDREVANLKNNPKYLEYIKNKACRKTSKYSLDSDEEIAFSDEEEMRKAK